MRVIHVHHRHIGDVGQRAELLRRGRVHLEELNPGAQWPGCDLLVERLDREARAAAGGVKLEYRELADARSARKRLLELLEALDRRDGAGGAGADSTTYNCTGSRTGAGASSRINDCAGARCGTLEGIYLSGGGRASCAIR